jgi:coatomer protein complex subunit gamma
MGEKFPTNEATTLFFGISKLFQNKDASLRQMVHLIIKELAHSAEDIIMVTSTIMKDTGGGTDAIYRPNAIRALCRIIDVSCDIFYGRKYILTEPGFYRAKYRACHENRNR